MLLQLALATGAAAAQPARAFLLGLLTQGDDERFSPQSLEHGYPEHPYGRSAPAAQIALDDSAFALQNAGYASAKLVTVEAPDAAGLPAALDQLLRQGVRHVLLELPAAGVAAVANAARGKDVILFNVAAPEDALRGAQCAPNLLHTIPSHAMQADALVQLLAVRKWNRVLVLAGPTPDDRLLQAAFQRSLKRFGLKPLAEKPFKLSNDPRERDLGNVRLLTAERDYDAVVVLDADGEFARDVPYRTVLPRLVLGSSGLTAGAWSFYFERQGAPQLNHRFEKKTNRVMGSYDWATWMAARAAAEAVGANPKATTAQLLQALKSDALSFDGYKGRPLSFRAWDGQLRQPLLLAHGNGVADIAPLEGFLHQRTTLDTLGYDAPETACKAR
nr:ABC transporter substrate-binding protein [Ramlibacter agri]